MQSISIGLDKFESFKKIINITDKFDEFYKNDIKKSAISENLFMEYANQHYIYLENKVFNKHKELTNEILETIHAIKTKKESQIESVFSDIEYDIKKDIFSYIYWNLKSPQNTQKIHMGIVKKLFGLKGTMEEHIIPVNYSFICPNCNGEGILQIYNYELNKYDYICLICNHAEKHEKYTYKESNKYMQCECERCNLIKKQLFKTYANNIPNLIIDIIDTFKTEYLKISNVDGIPSDSRMELDCKLNLGNLDKDVREILSFKPKTWEEIDDIIENIINRPYNLKNKNKLKNKLIEKLLDNKIIYKTSKNIWLDDIDEIINKYLKDLLIINKLIKNCNIEKFLELYRERIYISPRYSRVNEKIYTSEITITLGKEVFCEEYILNKYYFNKKVLPNTSKKFTKNIFKSETEKSNFICIGNVYEDYIIIPNQPLRRIIDIKQFKNLYTDEEYNYLNRCEVDFSIYDKEGNILSVKEVQRGDHHNNIEWIKKDELKIKILEYCGIYFDEGY